MVQMTPSRGTKAAMATPSHCFEEEIMSPKSPTSPLSPVMQAVFRGPAVLSKAMKRYNIGKRGTKVETVEFSPTTKKQQRGQTIQYFRGARQANAKLQDYKKKEKQGALAAIFSPRRNLLQQRASKARSRLRAVGGFSMSKIGGIGPGGSLGGNSKFLEVMSLRRIAANMVSGPAFADKPEPDAVTKEAPDAAQDAQKANAPVTDAP